MRVSAVVFFNFVFLLSALSAPLSFADNGDRGDAILLPLEPYGGFLRKLEVGEQIWTEHPAGSYKWAVRRDHTFDYLPDFLKGKCYVFSPMEYSRALVEKAGYVYVITPTPVEENLSGRFSKSAAGRVIPYFAPNLIDQGFERMEDIPEFKISKTLEETVAVYRKYAEKGEIIRYGSPSWGVTIAGLPDDFQTGKTRIPKLANMPATVYFDPAYKYSTGRKYVAKEYSYSFRNFQGIPGIEITTDGRLWATWYASNSGVYTEEPRNYAVLVTSGDGGNSWSEPPNLVVQHPVETIASKDPCPWIDPLGRLWFFWTQYDGLMSSSTSWAVTADNPEEENPEWSEPRQIGEGLLLNKPAVLSTGEWIFCSSRGGTPVNIYISTDKGKTISHYSQADVPGAGWNEHMVIEKKDGSLWMLVRTNRGIGQTFSHDRGRTWTQGELYRPGPSTRFHIRRLKSGRLLLITHPVEENTRRRASMTAYLSEDEGNSWPYELLLDGRDSVSYPDAVETADGVIYSVHDHSRAGKMQIILSVFTEEDIMAGKLVVKNSRLGVKISGKD